MSTKVIIAWQPELVSRVMNDENEDKTNEVEWYLSTAQFLYVLGTRYG